MSRWGLGNSLGVGLCGCCPCREGILAGVFMMNFSCELEPLTVSTEEEHGAFHRRRCIPISPS